jgi:hypothetical protein
MNLQTSPREARVGAPAARPQFLTGLATDFIVGLVALAGLTWQIWSDSAYTGDDANTLFPVAQHDVVSTLHYYIRPIEYAVVQAANQVWLPGWLVVSVLCAVLAACLQVRNAEIVVRRSFPPVLRAALVAGSPLWFYAISQVDTVSQSLCNLAFAAALHCLLRVLFVPDEPRAGRWLAALNLLSAVLLYTKELSVAASFVLPAAGAWIAWRKGLRRDAAWLASGLVLLVLFVGWIVLKLHFKSQMPEESGHYNLTPGPIDIARNTLATLAFGLTPLPTGLLSLAAFAKVWTLCGVAAAATLAWAAARLPWRDGAVRWFAFAIVGTCLPMFYVHSSELYVSMLGTLFVSIVVAMLRLRTDVTFAWCAVLLACSYANGFIYFHAAWLQAHGLERTAYSVYWGPNGMGQEKAPGALDCPLGRTVSVSWNCGELLCHQAGGDVIRVIVPHAERCTPAR